MFRNNSKDFISNIKETVDVTLATDDDRQLEAHNKWFTNQEASNFKNKLPLSLSKSINWTTISW
jgi:hypothetical protein